MTAGASLRRKNGEQRVRGVPTGAAGGHLSRCTLAYKLADDHVVVKLHTGALTTSICRSMSYEFDPL
jgi:hypothetical protein